MRDTLGHLTFFELFTLNYITMEKIQVTQQEIQEACKKQVHRNKKKYYRKVKHKNYGEI